MFVNLSSEEPTPLLDALADQQDEVLGLARVGLAELRIGHVSTIDVQANWKIVLENDNECLHCPTVHPKPMAVSRTSVALDPRLRLPLLPQLKGQDAPAAHFGAAPLHDHVPRRRRLRRAGARGLPDRAAQLPAGDRVPVQH